MNINLNNNSYVINVDNNKLNKFKDTFNKKSITIPKVINSFIPDKIFSKNKSYHLCCTIGHMLALYSAMIDQLEYCIIFEDDAYPIYENVHEQFNKILKDLNDKDWDILILGCTSLMTRDYSLKNIQVDKLKLFQNETEYCFKIKTKNINGSHSYIVKKSVYEKMLHYILSETNRTLNNKVLGMDKIFADLDCNTYICKKPIFGQLYNKGILLPRFLYDVGFCYGGIYCHPLNQIKFFK